MAAVWSSWAGAGDEDADKGTAPGEEYRLVVFLPLLLTVVVELW